jgi:ketosteroid isomerase-like protein
MENWGGAWQDYTMEPEEFIDAGDRVVVVIRMIATGKGSGVTLERRDALVYELRHRKVVRLDYSNNRDEALAAAGLP